MTATTTHTRTFKYKGSDKRLVDEGWSGAGHERTTSMSGFALECLVDVRLPIPR
jgi:hypothetical protein